MFAAVWLAAKVTTPPPIPEYASIVFVVVNVSTALRFTVCTFAPALINVTTPF